MYHGFYFTDTNTVIHAFNSYAFMKKFEMLGILNTNNKWNIFFISDFVTKFMFFLLFV